MTALIAILASLLVSLGGLLLFSTSKNKALKADVKVAAKRAKGFASLQSEQQQKRKEARVEKEELAKTADSELLRRANNLFR